MLRPEALSAADVALARDAGLSDDAIEDATMVAVLFSTYVRLADTLEFDIPPGEVFERSASMLLSAGYALPLPVAWLTRE